MKFKHFLFLLIAGVSSQVFAGGNNDTYTYKVDITSVKDDKVKITLVPPKITTDEVIFKMPKMVPGTYKIYDFGRFVSDFKVNCTNNANCTPTRIDDNSWKITNATKITSIEYYVEDTW